MNLTNQFKPIVEWAEKRGIFDSATPEKQFIKLQEEIGELAIGLLKNDKELVWDSIGDCVVVLTILAEMSGLPIEKCINKAYAEISDRTGQMKDGVFVKDK
jgi:NTP pyrophosphatase (non-canonical NTP hydrolase)